MMCDKSQRIQNKFTKYFFQQFDHLLLYFFFQIIQIQQNFMGTCCASPPNTDQKYLEYSNEIVQIINNIKQRAKDRKFSTLQLENNGKYYGQIDLYGRMNGYGQLQRDDKQYYGQFKNNLFHGQGILIEKNKKNDQEFFQSQKQKSKFNQFVTQEAAQQFCQLYYGTFKKGKCHGRGRQVRSSFQYEGQYEDGQRTKGKLQCALMKYQGSFLNNKFHGQGMIQFKNGSKYIGEFVNGKMDGFGKFFGPEVISQVDNLEQTRDTYIGRFKDGQFHGYGVYYWKDGSKYDGEYQKGKKNGYGRLKYDGVQYSGKWVNGVRESQGLLTKEGRTQFALWKQGKIII